MNPYTHFYLYARGWYKKSENIIDDLKILTGEFSSVPVQYIHERDVFQVLSELAWQEIKCSGNPEELFKKFIVKTENDGWEVACLNSIMLGEISTKEIGRPNFEILPPADGLMYELINSGNYNWVD